MGIPSLNSAIFYNVSLYFHCHLEQASLSFLSLVLKRQADYERAKRVEKYKSCKYNKYPGPRPQKQPFSWTAGSFFRPHPRKRPFLWIRHNNPKWSYQWKSAKLRQSSQINRNLV
jgi:hypothetical protein